MGSRVRIPTGSPSTGNTDVTCGGKRANIDDDTLADPKRILTAPSRLPKRAMG
jgi:hypothetical protein